MKVFKRFRRESDARTKSQPTRAALSITVVGVAAALLVLVLRARLHGLDVPHALLGAVAVAFFAAVCFGTYFLLRAVREHGESEQRFQQMASNIREIFWMIDTGTKRALYVNEAYEAITGNTCDSLLQHPTSYEGVIHPEDRPRVLGKLGHATQTGRFSERFRIVRSDGDMRWIQAQGFPVRNAQGKIFRLVGTAQDITEQKLAEDDVVRNLEIAEEARAEAEALRKATLALTQDLRMDFVMDALLRCLEELIPYTCARVLVPEGGPHVLALGERQIPESPKATPRYHPGHPLTLTADESPFLKRVLDEHKSILIPDTREEQDWQTFKGHSHLRSWLSAPLLASDRYLGFLSVGHRDANRYSQEHLRRAELLSIPAAAAIQNARLFAQAGMYASELEKRLIDLREAEAALAVVRGDQRSGDGSFEKIFRSTPVPLSVTTLKDGRFVEVNAAFEQRYGYTRRELIQRSVHDLNIWCDPADRALMLEQLQRGSAVRNRITWLRTKSGDLKLTMYSAETIYFEGQTCIVAISEDLPEFDRRKAN